MTETGPRVPPLAPESFTDEQTALVGDWSHLVFSRVLVRHPGMYRVFLPYIDQLIRSTSLPPRDREVLVLRTLALCDETYETHHHVMIARNAGMSDAGIEAARGGAGACLSSFDLALCRAAGELVRDRNVGDGTWAELAARYTREQLMEVVFLVGCYTVMAMLTKSFGMALESAPEDFENITALRQYT